MKIMYKKLLQIEAASGVEFSEKYLIGFLEEKNTRLEESKIFFLN